MVTKQELSRKRRLLLIAGKEKESDEVLREIWNYKNSNSEQAKEEPQMKEIPRPVKSKAKGRKK